jgi:hypothetical protein
LCTTVRLTQSEQAMRAKYSYAEILGKRAFLPSTSEGRSPVSVDLRRAKGVTRTIQVIPPTREELVTMLHIAWCAASTPRERKMLSLARACVMGTDPRPTRRSDDAAMRQKLLDELERVRECVVDVDATGTPVFFSEQVADFFASAIVDWFREEYPDHPHPPTADLIRALLVAKPNVGGRGKRKIKDPKHELFAAMRIKVTSQTLATESSRWIRVQPESRRRKRAGAKGFRATSDR